MRGGTVVAIAVLAGGGCRQLFGIDDTHVADDIVDGPTAAIDASGNRPDGPPGVPDGPPLDARACAATYPIAFGGHRYDLGGGQLSWTNASSACVADGAYLAIP